MGEKGSALFLIMVLVVIMAVLASGLAVIIADEVEMSSLNKTRIRARYRAEAGIERAFDEILNDPSINTDNLSSNISDDNYSITSVSLYDDPDNNGFRIYEITAQGNDSTITNQITIKIRINRITQSTVTAGESISVTEEIKLSGLVIASGDEINGEQMELAANMPNFTFDPENYVQMDQSGNVLDQNGNLCINSGGNRLTNEEPDCEGKNADWYLPNQTEFEDRYTSAFWNHWGTQAILPSNEIVYINNDLDLTNFAHSIRGGVSNDEPPAVVVVNGSVLLGGLIGNVENVIFIAKDDFEVLDGIGMLDDVLVYSGNRVEISAPGFEYNGMIISGSNTDFTSPSGEVSYKSVDMRAAFRTLDNNDPIFPRIVYWDQ